MDTLSASVLRDRKPQIGIVLASGLLDCPLTSEEVGETAAKVAENFQSLILETVKRM